MTEPVATRSDPSADPAHPTSDVWRKEIHARVAGYRTRRGRRIEGAFTMRFPFPPSEAMESDSALEELAPAAAEEIRLAEEENTVVVVAEAGVIDPRDDTPVAASEVGPPVAASVATPVEEPEAPALLPVAEPEPPPLPRPAPAPRPHSRRKVIAFPRHASEAPVLHRLADPIVPEQPRILDVPEELEAYPGTPLLDGLQFPLGAQAATAAHSDHIELPFQVITLGKRLYAGLVDCAVVAVATGIFGAVCYKMLPRLQLTKPLLLAAAAVPVLLWAIYHYLLVVYGCTTAGMRVAGIWLSTFKGSRPKRNHRRSRVIGLYFSTASLMMGLLWALVDVDRLCWHDRISRTYLTNRQ